jgi:hypothetical protein
MLRERPPGASAIVLLSLAGLGIPACAEAPLGADSTRVRHEREALRTRRVPFTLKANVQLTGPVIPPPEPCLQLANSTIVGEATHLGSFSGVGSTCILDQVAPDPEPPFTAPGPPPYATAHFTNPRWTLTGANGDELWLETTEAVAVLSAVDNSLRARGWQRIVGGTGRFEGATGRLMARAVNEDGQGPDAFTATGWIRFSSRGRR